VCCGGGSCVCVCGVVVGCAIIVLLRHKEKTSRLLFYCSFPWQPHLLLTQPPPPLPLPQSPPPPPPPLPYCAISTHFPLLITFACTRNLESSELASFLPNSFLSSLCQRACSPLIYDLRTVHVATCRYVRYEAMCADTPTVLGRMLDFAGYRTVPASLECTLREYTCHSSNATYPVHADLFSKEQIDKILKDQVWKSLARLFV
jgi:hypothetical protein